MANPIAVAASRLGKSFGTRHVLDDLTFSVAPGEVVGGARQQRRGQDDAPRADPRIHPGQHRGSTARRRWEEMDWMACRPERAIRVRAAT
jgi:hypothetical protein